MRGADPHGRIAIGLICAGDVNALSSIAMQELCHLDHLFC